MSSWPPPASLVGAIRAQLEHSRARSIQRLPRPIGLQLRAADAQLVACRVPWGTLGQDDPSPYC